MNSFAVVGSHKLIFYNISSFLQFYLLKRLFKDFEIHDFFKNIFKDFEMKFQKFNGLWKF